MGSRRRRPSGTPGVRCCAAARRPGGRSTASGGPSSAHGLTSPEQPQARATPLDDQGAAAAADVALLLLGEAGDLGERRAVKAVAAEESLVETGSGKVAAED